MIHLTYTGVYAGQLLCGTRRSDTTDQDSFAHFVYASDQLIDGPDTCERCRHMARCDLDECAICDTATVYDNAFTGHGTNGDEYS